MDKTKRSALFLIVILAISAFLIAACSTQVPAPEKSGAQLWGENCVRCHNAPSPSAFGDNQWETVTMHMKVRANLNSSDVVKIVDFLQMAN